MEVINIIKDFNIIIESLLLQLKDLVGITYHYNFNKLIQINATQPIEYSIIYLLPYKNNILSKDENYFLDDNMLNNTMYTDNILSEIFRLKNIYIIMDESSKENIWNIFQALIQLTIEYCIIKNISY